MAFSSEKLLRELDSSSTIDWALELKYRKDALIFILHEVKEDRLNKDQLRNALHMLFRIAFPENADQVLEALVEASAHSDIEIRSEAVQLAIGMVRVSKNLKTHLEFSAAQQRLLRMAINQGLTPKVADLVKEYFK